MKNCTKLILLIVILSILNSCDNKKRNENEVNTQKQTSENSSNNAPSIEKERTPLPEGYVWGKVEPYVGKNKTEQNIMSQMGTYMSALYRGDIEGAADFLYPDAITYFRKYYPDYFTDRDIIREFYKVMSDSYIEGLREYNKRGMEFDFIVTQIDKIIETDTAIFCVFGLTIQVGKDNKYFHIIPTKDDYTIGISLNNGKNWYFIARNEDTPNILRLKFSNQVITQIMDY